MQIPISSFKFTQALLFGVTKETKLLLPILHTVIPITLDASQICKAKLKKLKLHICVQYTIIVGNVLYLYTVLYSSSREDSISNWCNQIYMLLAFL